ncbi:MAG: chaperone NapD [Gammaproteobacteria bacterium]|nr:chaperone NapD [Gammaproteobacteria bacterium]
MANNEYHVASYVVSTRPEHGGRVAECINGMPGLEVHVEQQGKLVVTAEARDVRELAEFATSLEDIGGVISVAPVYHEYENTPGAIIQ